MHGYQLGSPPRIQYHRRLTTDVTHLLSALDKGDRHAASRLLPLVYVELRRLAAQRMAQEQPATSREHVRAAMVLDITSD